MRAGLPFRRAEALVVRDEAVKGAFDVAGNVEIAALVDPCSMMTPAVVCGPTR